MLNHDIEMPHHDPARHLARLVLFSFVLTFVLARLVVFLIMSRRIPDLFFYFGGTHIHHLNYGIFLLAWVGTFLLFEQPTGWELHAAGLIWGVDLALTFDEFGMWLHLGGSYWQRANYDAVTLIAALFGLIAFAPPLSQFRSKHWWGLAIIILVVIIAFFLYVESSKYAAEKLGPHIQQIERTSPHSNL
jgi:hypothetical protein